MATTATMCGFSGMFTHFLYHLFLLSSSLTARSLPSTFLANGYGHTRPHNRRPRWRQCMARTGHVDTDMPTPHHVIAPTHTTSLCSSPAARTVSLGLCHRMRHVAVPLVAACTALPCPSRLHAPRRCARSSFRWLIFCLYAFFFLFSTNFLFCSLVTMPQWHNGDVATRT